MTKICVPIYGENATAARAMAEKAFSGGADLIEIRADLIGGIDIDGIEKTFSDQLDSAIVTLRSKTEGGESDLSQDERKEWLKSAMKLQPALIDLEFGADQELISGLSDNRDKIIVSRHFMGVWTLENVIKAITDCTSFGGIGKVAVEVSNAMQTIWLLEILREFNRGRYAIMAFGPGGELTRALAPALGSELVYSALDESNMVAAGQLGLDLQKRMASKERIVVGLIGHPVGHSLSPVMHNAAFGELGLPGVYLPFDIPDAVLVPDFMRSARKLGVRGFNVTIPYKETALAAVDILEDDAKRAGAVNTIAVDNDGALRGYNTDIFGFSESLRRAKFDPRDKRVLIIGAGGASRAAIIALWKMGANVTIANRTPERAEELVRSMRVFVKTMSLDEIVDEKPFNLIVNATPIGMKGFDDSLLIPPSFIVAAQAVMDMVYNPIETPLMRAAREHTITTISGLEMLLYQGAKAFEIWTGTPAPVEAMRMNLKEAIGE